MESMRSLEYSDETQTHDASALLDMYSKLPQNKKPIFMIMLQSIMVGMEMQELLGNSTEAQEKTDE